MSSEDLVARLRATSRPGAVASPPLCHEAADRIECLRDALQMLATEEWRDDDDPVLKAARVKARRALAEDDVPPARTRCPHGNSVGDCNACDVAADFAYDAAREDRAFGR